MIFQENILKEIEEFNLHNETMRFYRMVNKMRKEFKSRISACRKKDGEMINNKREILERWNQYFQEFLEGKQENDETDNVEKASEEHQDNQGGTNLPTVNELEKAIDKLKNNKASGLDNINAELIKSSKPVLINIPLKIIQKVWEN
jgi:hypothetical protein